ncbi:MAG: ATP-binding protein [Pseudomonadota bacterium]
MPWRRLTQRLSLRLWLAVVAAVMVLTVIVGWAWRQAAEPPLREVRIRNEAGQMVATAQSKPRDADEDGDGQPDKPRQRGGPEFEVTLPDGQVLNIQVARTQRSSFWTRPPFGFFWTLGLVALGVALATYPIVRRLTQRLESLQRGVEQWGDGDLSVRVPVAGDDEIAFLASRFNHAAGRIERLVQSHKSLLANASHELRSPLARIRMGLELMGGNPDSPSRAEIERNIAELDLLVDEILLASRLDAQQADVGTFETVDLTGLAAEECAQLPAPYAELHAEFDAPPVAVHGVARLLRRLIRNLLENARRYGDGTVQVHLAAQGGRAVLRVSDRGPGVPAAQRERIFEPFYRLPGASEREGGVGLGLALVKSIAERHGGTVRCEDQQGGGASFVVELPLQAGAVPAGHI